MTTFQRTNIQGALRAAPHRKGNYTLVFELQTCNQSVTQKRSVKQTANHNP
jgi:hypothetical protein